jgi:hypothetical protein
MTKLSSDFGFMEKGNVVIIAKVIGYEALGITEVWSVRSRGSV